MSGTFDDGRTWRRAAFFLSAGAAAVHIGAAPGHLKAWAPAGAFMLVSGVAQLVWAIAVTRTRSRIVLDAGVALNAGIIVLWIETRTLGLPFGPHRGPEHVHGADLLATLLETLIIVVATSLAAERQAHPVVVRAALFGALIAPLAGGDDPVHETVVAAATLALAFAANACIAVFPARAPDWRSHAKAWITVPGNHRRIGRVRARLGPSR